MSSLHLCCGAVLNRLLATVPSLRLCGSARQQRRPVCPRSGAQLAARRRMEHKQCSPGLASRSWWPRCGAHSGSLGRLHSLCSCVGM